MRTSEHLNQEALLRLQMGDASEAEREHVAMCKECQAQAKPLDDALSWFGAAARQWGEEKAAVAEEAKAAAAMQWQESKSAAACNPPVRSKTACRARNSPGKP